jgi:cell division septal protein FtsQ
MDRSRRAGTKQGRPDTEIPASSRLVVRAKRNRKRPVSLWSRVPRRGDVLDACGRAVRRSLPALAAIGILAVIGAGVLAGYYFVTTSDRFAIATIEIHGAQQVSTDDIRAHLPAHVGDNIFTTDLDTVTSVLERDPWIRDASAHRELPDTLVVEIREHVAAAVVQLGDELYLVDEAGHPFKRADAASGEMTRLPIVTGIPREAMRGAPHETARLVVDALAVITSWREKPARPEVGEIHIDAHHAITLRSYDRGFVIQLGLFRDVTEQIATFDAVWAELTDAERAHLSTLHLDARSDHVTIAFAKD